MALVGYLFFGARLAQYGGGRCCCDRGLRLWTASRGYPRSPGALRSVHIGDPFHFLLVQAITELVEIGGGAGQVQPVVDSYKTSDLTGEVQLADVPIEGRRKVGMAVSG